MVTHDELIAELAKLSRGAKERIVMEITWMKQYAEVGARIRLSELESERQRILEAFPNLNGDMLPDNSEIGRVLDARVPVFGEAVTRTRKPMSMRQRKQVSRRMKAYWREKENGMKTGYKKHYAGVLDIPAGKLDGVEVRHIDKPAGTTLSTGTLRTSLFGQASEKVTFDEPTRWHELSEDGRGVWMTDYPVEQRQHDEMIGRSGGRVLVGGLGLGYAVVALAARPKVREIVVVEQNHAIIDLVWEATVARIKTLFPKRKVKLSVINMDLFDFLKERQAAKRKKPEFAWGLFDIWQGDGETTFHEVVVPLRALAHGVVASLACWNEDVMRGQLYQGLESRLHLLTMSSKRKAALGMATPTIEQLTADSDSIWQQWAVPFWRWFKDHAYDGKVYNEELVRFVMAHYVKSYGRPEALNGLPHLRPYRSEMLKAMEEGATS